MMNYVQAENKIMREDGVDKSTMMKTPCIRHHGNFMAMVFDKEDSLIVKVSPERVNQLVSERKGNEFNFTKKRFKEWILIPIKYEDDYESYIYESLEYAKKSK